MAGSLSIRRILGAREHDLAPDDRPVHADHDARERARVPAPEHRTAAEGDAVRPVGRRDEELDVVRLAVQVEAGAVADEVAGAARVRQLVDAPPGVGACAG